MNVRIKPFGLFLAVLVALSGCKLYQQDILFRLDEDFSEGDLSAPVQYAESNYLLAVNDYFTLDVYTNKGERVIDPNNELNINNQNRQTSRQPYQYLIQGDGFSKLPIIDRIKLAGFTINEAETVLQQAYDDFYKECFVKITLTNRRVVVLGAGGSQVIPLHNENMTLAEILAIGGGVSMGQRAGNIRIIRGDLSNPQVFQIDLTTVSGMRSTITEILPGDIIYIEPWRRTWLEAMRDISPIMSATSGLIAFVLLIKTL